MCDSAPGGGDPEVCKPGGGGLLLPLFGDTEQGWPNELRVVLYLVGLLWCFMGVAIIADVFMGAIEKITSKKVLYDDKKLGKKRTRTVWNPTVANLTLMALGSSAPEILLNVVGIFPSFTASELGPSTIVGSAAFNLLIISAVCVVAIPNGEVRKINDMGVFACTCFFSIFAYVWLLIILALPPSQDVVTVYEGVITFLFFFVLVVMAFLFDVGKMPGFAKPHTGLVVQKESTPDEICQMEYEVRQKYGHLTAEQVATLIEYEFYSPQSRAAQRVNATRLLVGGKKLMAGESKFEKGAKLAKELLAKATKQVIVDSTHKPTVAFKALDYTVLESHGTVEVTVMVHGDLQQEVKVSYTTRDGTATKGSDYEHRAGVLTLGPNKSSDVIKIKIVNEQGTHESTEEFYVDIAEIGNDSGMYLLSKQTTCTIVIIDEDCPGQLKFQDEQLEVAAKDESHEIAVKINRHGGFTGKVTCKVVTEEDSAIANMDFEPIDSVLAFDNGQASAEVKLKILPKGRYENAEMFRLVLKEPTGGLTFDRTTDGGSDQAIMSVIIGPNKETKGRIEHLSKVMAVNWDNVSVGNANYKDQFIAAVYCNGSAEDQKQATVLDWVMHILALPWKLLFALVPPVEYAGGWVCFLVALFMIGFVTVIIGDMAELLGCTMGISAATTAITFVALGTSLPDTFASKSAAVMDPYADNCIGNITGSNSVNVFLGLGLPWMIQAIFWEVAECKDGDNWSLLYPDVAKDYPKGTFAVPAGSLAISVSTFCGCAVVCVAILMVRRKVLGGELGGPKGPAIGTAIAFVLSWLVYVVVSIMSE